MRYTVVWTPAAEQRLAAVWMVSADRHAVTEAAARADQRLGVDPDTQGVPRYDTVRTMVEGPLGVEFEVNEPDRLVRVLTVWDATQQAGTNGAAH